ncbi:MAG TPA: hypothetical protein PLS49_06500 [Candidatus Woesebacteria bacterium]|nr:hypothetical protein [Candidatus Woesebacteria bacterium]
MKKILWIVIIIVCVLLLLFINRSNKNTSSSNRSPTSTEVEKINFSEEVENEILYRFFEVQSEIGFDTAPEVGKKEQKTTKRDEAIRIVAKEYDISFDQTNKIINKVQMRRPTEEEFNIFEIYDKKLDEAIDTVSEEDQIVNEDSIRQEVSESLGISQKKLSHIWVRVSAWKLENTK